MSLYAQKNSLRVDLEPQTEFHLVPNRIPLGYYQAENSKYNPIPVDLTRIGKDFKNHI